MASKSRPKLEERRATNIAFVELTGAYDALPWQPTMERLYGWAKSQKVMPGFFPMATYLDPPDEPAETRRTRIFITFKGRAKASQGVKTGKLPRMRVATLSHRGPGSAFPDTYARLQSWIDERGFRPAGPPIEAYSKRPVTEAGVTIIFAKVMVPVKAVPTRSRKK